MVILHAYLKKEGNVIASLPFRYNNGDDKPVEARELVLEVSDDSTYDSIRQEIVELLDKEKQDVEQTDGFGGMVPYVTID